MIRSFEDLIHICYRKDDANKNCRDITLQITDDCCLKCTYCYQINKGHRVMSFDTAKKIIDLLFKMYDDNEPDAIINKDTIGVVIDFIGGEPLMNVDLIEQVIEYFFNECIKRHHIWFTNSRFSMSSNGILYFDPKVQHLLEKYGQFISLTITIDGPKELHDSCRIDLDGNGSFDRVFAAWQHWITHKGRGTRETKVTIAPENLPYLDKIFDFFIQHGVEHINANPIFEHEWTVEESQLYYKQLISLADILLRNDKVSSSLFEENFGHPLLSTDTHNWCGGTGAMLAFDPEGIAYPCLRYMPSSLGTDVPPIIIGDTTGLYNTKETKAIKKELDNITRQSQSTEECCNCHIASGCGWCSAWNYQHFGTPNKRSTSLCWMHRAAALANVYYWNLYYHKKQIKKYQPLYLDRGIATKIITNEEYDKLLTLSIWR